MYRQVLDPVARSLWLSALVALLPLATIFVMLAVLRVKAHWAALAGLAAALLVAISGYGMPAKLALLSASQGAAFGLFPIMWIVIAAIWIYQLTVSSGRFEDLHSAFGLISADHRIQVLVIAFCFGALLEALAGFGAPLAITGVMLVALGLRPGRAAASVLVANTAPVAFGAIATPIITAGLLTKIPYSHVGAYVGRQTPLLALFVPLVLLLIADGRRGVRQAWPAAAVCGLSFALAQFVASNYISVELTDIIASLFSLAALVLFLRVWQPKGGAGTAGEYRTAAAADGPELDGGPGGLGGGPASGPQRPSGPVSTLVGSATPAVTGTAAPPSNAGGAAQRVLVPVSPGRVMMALLPYLVIVVAFTITKAITPVSDYLVRTAHAFPWPGLNGHILTPKGKVSTSTVFSFPWLTTPGTLLFICGLIVTALYRIAPATAARELAGTVYRLRWAIVTVVSVLAFAYVMNQSGQTSTIGTWIAGAGAAFAFLSPILGWLGTAVTGSDTSSNALFATLQQVAAAKAGLNPTLLVAANASGGVVGKMISPQNLTIVATAVGLTHQEGILFRRVIKWSLALLLALCVLAYLQSTVLAGILP
jgi:lactate permease